MFPKRIDGATKELTPPEGMGGCVSSLVVREEQTGEFGGPSLTSAWEPTFQELRALNAGASVLLTVLGTSHPVVALTVGDAPQ